MRTSARTRYAGYRFPAEIIGHAVWLYFRFPLGLRMVGKDILPAPTTLAEGQQSHVGGLPEPRTKSGVSVALSPLATSEPPRSDTRTSRPKIPLAHNRV